MRLFTNSSMIIKNIYSDYPRQCIFIKRTNARLSVSGSLSLWCCLDRCSPRTKETDPPTRTDGHKATPDVAPSNGRRTVEKNSKKKQVPGRNTRKTIMKNSPDADAEPHTCVATAPTAGGGSGGQRKKRFPSRWSLRHLIYSSPILNRRRSQNASGPSKSHKTSEFFFVSWEKPRRLFYFCLPSPNWTWSLDCFWIDGGRSKFSNLWFVWDNVHSKLFLNGDDL